MNILSFSLSSNLLKPFGPHQARAKGSSCGLLRPPGPAQASGTPMRMLAGARTALQTKRASRSIGRRQRERSSNRPKQASAVQTRRPTSRLSRKWHFDPGPKTPDGIATRIGIVTKAALLLLYGLAHLDRSRKTLGCVHCISSRYEIIVLWPRTGPGVAKI